MTSAIYIILNKITDDLYVGKSKDVEKRWKQHKYKLRHNKHENDYLQNAWNYYGSDVFSFEIIKEAEPEYLDELEIFYIAFYDSYNNGYNLTIGGDGGSKGPLSEEEKLAISKATNSTGFFCVSKEPCETCNQKIRWRYSYYDENKKKKSINFADLEKLMLEVTLNDLPWKIIDLDNALASIEENNSHETRSYTKHDIWDSSKCHYKKDKMFGKNRNGNTPYRCFATRYNAKDIPIGLNMDFTTCELIHDLIEEFEK